MMSAEGEMRGILKFLVEVSRIKSLQRTGWVWLGVKNPETVAEHSFRTAVMAWMLGRGTGLDLERVIELALIHDIGEAYAGDLTPYYGILPKNPQERKRVLGRWIRLPKREKARLAARRVRLEEGALRQLLRPLSPRIQRELFSLWHEYEKGLSPEGKFVKQIDKIEALLQAIEYFGAGPRTPVVGWWEEVEELVDHPVLLKFLQSIESYFYRKERGRSSPLIVFFTSIGRLKRMPRSGWRIRGVKNPESMANHSFFLALMCIVLTRARSVRLERGEMLKTAMIHLLPYISMQEATPYDEILVRVKRAEKRKNVFKEWIRYPTREKRAMFLRRYRKERQVTRRLIHSLPIGLRREIWKFWENWKQNRSAEARFLRQLYVAEILLQALRYRAGSKRFHIASWWEWAYEFADTPLIFDLLEEYKRRFRFRPGT